MSSTSSRLYLVERRRTFILPSRIQAEYVDVQILRMLAASVDEIQSGGADSGAEVEYMGQPYLVLPGWF